eukprot:3546980-Amphidinium_carterae.1
MKPLRLQTAGKETPLKGKPWRWTPLVWTLMPKRTLEHVPGCPAPDTPSVQSRPTKPLWMPGWPAFQMRVGVAGTLSGLTSSQRTARLSGKPQGPCPG